MIIFLLFYFIPMIMIVFGVFSYFFTPKKNKWFGYRTINSLKNDDSWKYANKICGCYWLIAGIVLALIATIFLLVFGKHIYFNTIKIVNFIIEIVIMLSVIPYTEIKTRKMFKK